LLASTNLYPFWSFKLFGSFVPDDPVIEEAEIRFEALRSGYFGVWVVAKLDLIPDTGCWYREHSQPYNHDFRLRRFGHVIQRLPLVIEKPGASLFGQLNCNR
jgi:hypothetical protein